MTVFDRATNWRRVAVTLAPLLAGALAFGVSAPIAAAEITPESSTSDQPAEQAGNKELTGNSEPGDEGTLPAPVGPAGSSEPGNTRKPISSPDAGSNLDDTQKPVAPSATMARIAIPNQRPFWDIAVTGPFASEVAWAKHNGITTGWSDGSFRGAEGVTREALAAFLYRLAGSPQVEEGQAFADVRPGHSFYREIQWMRNQHLANGWSDGTFRPKLTASRAAMAAILHRFCMQLPGVCSSNVAAVPALDESGRWVDVSADNEFAKDISWLTRAGVTAGMSADRFGPWEPVQRYAMIAFVFRIQNNAKTPVYLPAAPVRAVNPPIDAGRYQQLGGPVSAFTRDGIYTVQFNRGVIFRSVDTRYIDGDLFSQWLRRGGLNGMGYPRANAKRMGGVSVQVFDGGTLFEGAGERFLNVPWKGQPNHDYCGPTSGYMVLASQGRWRSVHGQHLSVDALATSEYMNTYRRRYTSFHDRMFERGVNRWVGFPVYDTFHTPSADALREQIWRSFQSGWPTLVDEQERRGGPHVNGHNNATYSHIMVVDGYDFGRDRMRLVDPGADGHVWGRARQRFWVNNLHQFVLNHMTYEVERDGLRHIGMYAPSRIW